MALFMLFVSNHANSIKSSVITKTLIRNPAESDFLDRFREMILHLLQRVNEKHQSLSDEANNKVHHQQNKEMISQQQRLIFHRRMPQMLDHPNKERFKNVDLPKGFCIEAGLSYFRFDRERM